ncbi:MAG: hypothetical protein ACOYMV_08930, partial [Verrucomicrobiia bacterium]
NGRTYGSDGGQGMAAPTAEEQGAGATHIFAPPPFIQNIVINGVDIMGATFTFYGKPPLGSRLPSVNPSTELIP